MKIIFAKLAISHLLCKKLWRFIANYFSAPMKNVAPTFVRKVHYRDLWTRIVLCIIAAHWLVSFGEPECIFELFLMGDYWRSLGGSWVIAFGLVSLVRWICLRLDQRLDWQHETAFKGVAQAVTGVGLLSLLAYLAAAVYFAAHGIDIRDTVNLSLDWPQVVAMLLVINLYYLVYYIVVAWRGERNAANLTTYRQVIIVQFAAKNIPVNVRDIAYFFRVGEENFLRTVDGTDYLVASALDYFEDILDPVDFFRVNRQFLVNFNSCQRYETIENDKLELIVSPAFKERIVISQKRASVFKVWIGR